MMSFKNSTLKFKFEMFLWAVLAFFLGLILIGLVMSFFDSKVQFFSLVTEFLDFLFSVLGVLNPITHYIGIEFKPVFGGAANELTNKNPIIMRTLSNAALTTLFISITAMVGGFIIANIVAVILILPDSNFQFGLNLIFFKTRLTIPVKFFFRLYVDIFRSTPLVLQMLIAAYGLPQVVQSYGSHSYVIGGIHIITISLVNFRISELNAAILALGLNTGAYQSELIRAGILSIPVGQTEAARGLGFTQFQTFRYVIIPQALRLIIPPLTNEGINVILNSSLAYVLSVPELTRKAEDMATIWFLTIQILATAGIFYFVMTYSLANLSKKVEKKFKIPGLGVQHE